MFQKTLQYRLQYGTNSVFILTRKEGFVGQRGAPAAVGLKATVLWVNTPRTQAEDAPHNLLLISWISGARITAQAA